MFNDSIFFIQEDDVVCFFTHQFCLLENRKQKKKAKKKNKMKLRYCCETKCEIGVV